jgi:hypothetical protein
VRLAHAYTTPQSRGTLFRVLAGIPEVRSLGGVELADGRRGQAVEIPPAAEAGARPDSWRGEQRVVFDTRTAELLEWRSPGESYTFWPRDLARLPRAERAAAGEVTRGVVWRTLVFRRAAGVERIGERP